MRSKWIALLATVALLSACAAPPTHVTQKQQPWNGGIWNSTLGYVGPANVMVTN